MIPQYLECHYKEDLPNDFRFQLSNTSGNSMSMRLYYDSSVFRIDKDSIQLPRFKTIYVNVSFLPPTDDTSLDSQIMICCGGNSYPIVYHVAFRPDKKLEVTSESGDVLPASFEIGEPYPNPFNSSTRFEILNSIGGELEMEVYNLLGQNVYSKVEKTGGRKYLIWDGHDIEGYEVPSGIYFFRFKRNGMVLMRKAILLK